MMRIYLISLLEPSYYGSVFFVADALELNGHETQVVCKDMDAWATFVSEFKNRQWLYDDITRFNPDMIGFSSVRQSYRSIPWMSKLLKRKFPEIPLICGGEGPSQFGEELINTVEALDYAFYGEAEEMFPLFLERYRNNSSYKDVRGLIYRSNGETVVNPPPKRVDFSSYIPIRQWARYLTRNQIVFNQGDDSDVWEGYSATPFGDNKGINLLLKNPIIEVGWKPLFGDIFGILLTRGCPYSCSFCGTPYHQLTHMAPQAFEKQLDEIIPILDTLTDRFAIFVKDASFDLNKKWAVQIAEILGSHPRQIEWCCQLRPNLVDEPFAAALRKNRCRSVNLYAESTCDRIRNDILKKQISDRQLINSFEVVKRQKLDIRTNIIVDIPEETHYEKLQTISALRRLPSDHFLAFRLIHWADAEIRHLEKEIELEDGLAYDVEKDELKKVKQTSGYSTRPYDPTSLFPINIHGHRLGKLIRSKVKPTGSVLIADTVPVPFDCLSILVSALALHELDDHGQPITVLAQRDAVLHEKTFPESVNVVRANTHPMSIPRSDKFWTDLLRQPYHTMLCSSFNTDEEAISRVFEIATYLEIETVVWVVFSKKIDVVEFDVASKKIIQSSYATSISAIHDVLQGK